MKLLLLLAVVSFATEPSLIKTRAEVIVSLSRNSRGYTPKTDAAVREAFLQINDSELKPEALKTYDTRTLEVLFSAVEVALDSLPKPELLSVLEDIFEQCLSRGFLGHMIDSLHSQYIQQREFEKARELFKKFPSDDRKLPEIVEPASGTEEVPALYTVSKDGKTLNYRAVDLSGPHIVSSVSPGCHFSNAIVKVIEADKRLLKLFRRHAINVYAGTYNLHAQDIARTNRKDKFQYEILYRASGWRGFDFSSTPIFYFVKDGKIIHVMDEATPAKFKEQLAEGLKAIGL